MRNFLIGVAVAKAAAKSHGKSPDRKHSVISMVAGTLLAILIMAGLVILLVN